MELQREGLLTAVGFYVGLLVLGLKEIGVSHMHDFSQSN